MLSSCPVCKGVVSHVNGDGVEINMGYDKKTWNGVLYKCPHCNTVLGCQIDPIAIKSDIVDELFKRLKAGR